MTKFNVVINPFARKILVWARVNKVDCDVVMDWNGESDWWESFEMNGKLFDFHLLYDEELTISIFPAPPEGEQSIYAEFFKTTFKLTHKDEF